MALSEVQQNLVRHFQELPETLPEDLVEASREGIVIFGGDLSLERVSRGDLFYNNVRAPDFEGDEAILLRSASGLYFAYDPDTREEIANTMSRYGVTDRAEVARTLASDLRSDAVYQKRVKGRLDFYRFGNACADVLESRA